MKKLIILIVFIALLGMGAYAGYRYYLPTVIAEALTSDEPSALVPESMQSRVDAIKQKVNREVKKLPVLLEETKLGFDDLINITNRVQPSQLLNAYREIAATPISSSNQVFDIGMKHIKVEGYDLEVFRSEFVQSTSVKNIRETIAKIEKSDMVNRTNIAVAKDTVKKILISSRQDIQEILNDAELKR
jgi:hypothetical protein